MRPYVFQLCFYPTMLLFILSNTSCSEAEFARAGNLASKKTDTDDDGSDGTDGKNGDNKNGIDGDEGLGDSETGNGRFGSGGGHGDDASESSILSTNGENTCLKIKGPDKETKTAASGKGTTFFFENVAVDPGNKNHDPALGSYGKKKYPEVPNDTLNETSFKLNAKDFEGFKTNYITEIEWIVFGHQFGLGLDKITIEVKTKEGSYASDHKPNIYSAYGLISLKNLVVEDDDIRGDLLISSYSYDPNSSLPHDVAIRKIGDVSSQVGINFVGPSSEAIAPDLEEKNISLKDFKLDIKIDADTYDSVQYRSIQGIVWGDREIPECD